MKRIRIGLQKVGLVYRDQDFRRILLPGNYWIGFNETVLTYNQSQVYNALNDMEIAMSDANFAKSIEQVYVKENEIALVYVRNTFKLLLKGGNYFYFKGKVEFKIDTYDLNSVEEIAAIDKSILNNVEIAPFIKMFKLETYEKGLLFQEGKFIKELSGGSYSFWNGPKTIDLFKVDLRNSLMEISGQELLTKDKAALRINFQLEYRVVNVNAALIENKDYSKQLYTSTQLAIRDILGSYTLDELLQSKEEIGDFVLNVLKLKTQKLGVEVSSAGIRDIILPGEVKDIMNQVLIAEKKAQANAIARREETASTRTMLNTAKLMEDNTILYKLKEMEYVEKIAEKIGEIKLSNNGSVIDQLTQVFTK